MTDCYSVHLIKRIVMTFHLFTFNIALVFSDESNEKTVRGKHFFIIFSFTIVVAAVQKVTYPEPFRPPPRVQNCGREQPQDMARCASYQHASERNTLLLRYLRATDLKNPEVQ